MKGLIEGMVVWIVLHAAWLSSVLGVVGSLLLAVPYGREWWLKRLARAPTSLPGKAAAARGDAVDRLARNSGRKTPLLAAAGIVCLLLAAILLALSFN